MTIEMPENGITKEKLGIYQARVVSQVLGNNINPIAKLHKAIREENWFEGLILSCTYFEMFGVLSLKTYFETISNVEPKQHGIISVFLGRAQLAPTIKLLYFCGLVSSKTYAHMMKIKDARNKIVHRTKVKDKAFVIPEEINNESKTKALKLIEDAIECIKELGAIS
jgi:hypothetical protein